MASTGMAGLAMIAVGHIDRARAAGDYVLAWIDRQEELPRCIFPQWHTDRGFIYDATENDHPPNGNAPLVISHDAAEADYWLCSILIAFLSELYMVTGESCYLDAALRVFKFAQASPELGNVCRSHKFAWGAARLYAVSRDRRCLEAGCRVAERLLEAQQPDGHFVYLDVQRPEAERPHAMNINVTSQFLAWMAALVMQMGEGSTAWGDSQ